MSLYDEITEALQEAMDGDLAETVTAFNGTRPNTGEYDPVTDTYTDSDPVTYEGRGIYVDYESSSIDGVHIQSGDQQIIALSAEVTDTPKVDDLIDGWRVITVDRDPVGAVYTIQVRLDGGTNA